MQKENELDEPLWTQYTSTVCSCEKKQDFTFSYHGHWKPTEMVMTRVPDDSFLVLLSCGNYWQIVKLNADYKILQQQDLTPLHTRISRPRIYHALPNMMMFGCDEYDLCIVLQKKNRWILVSTDMFTGSWAWFFKSNVWLSTLDPYQIVQDNETLVYRDYSFAKSWKRVVSLIDEMTLLLELELESKQECTYVMVILNANWTINKYSHPPFRVFAPIASAGWSDEKEKKKMWITIGCGWYEMNAPKCFKMIFEGHVDAVE